MEKRIISVAVALLMIGAVANAASTWVNGAVGNWTDPTKWDVVPTGTDTANIGNGTATIDTGSAVCGIVLMGYAAGTNGTLNIDTDTDYLAIQKSSSQLFSMSNNATGTGVVNHSDGVVKVARLDGATTGELRMVAIAGGVGRYYLSGGSLDVGILNRGAKERDGQFIGTGGTLVIRNSINKFGLAPTYSGFHLGSSMLAPGGVDRISASYIGVGVTQAGSTDPTDFFGDTGTVEIDIAGTASYDVVKVKGNYNLNGTTIKVNLLNGYTGGGTDSFFDIFTEFAMADTTAGSGTPILSAPGGWSYLWKDTDIDGDIDTLRLFVPEPSTLALIGLGVLGLIRRKR